MAAVDKVAGMPQGIQRKLGEAGMIHQHLLVVFQILVVSENIIEQKIIRRIWNTKYGAASKNIFEFN